MYLKRLIILNNLVKQNKRYYFNKVPHLEKKYHGSCHCKKILYTFYCKRDVDVIICNCSVCSPLNYYHLIIPHNKFKLLSGKDYLEEYRFGTKKAKHLFCRVCGIKSFYQPRSHEKSYSINFKCVINPPKIRNIIEFNGKDFNAAIKSLSSRI